MRFQHATAEIYVPDGLPVGEALARTTHLAIGAHPDDLEIMAAAPIIQCFQRKDQWFTGVVVTDGRGSPRADLYRENSDEQMRRVRFQEQRKAAVIGEYGALVSLDYPSEAVKDRENHKPDEDVSSLLKIARPVHVFTHNLADRHDTHIAVAMRVIRAIRSLPGTDRPERLFGCVVWRDLDWMLDEDKVTFDLSSHENIQTALLGICDSQISGGKRYDLATMGRR